jgi:hypothetical protein
MKAKIRAMGKMALLKKNTMSEMALADAVEDAAADDDAAGTGAGGEASAEAEEGGAE